MSNGTEQRDTCNPISVVLDPQKVELLRGIVRRAGAILGQEKMYFEQTGGQVEFLDPAREDVTP